MMSSLGQNPTDAKLRIKVVNNAIDFHHFLDVMTREAADTEAAEGTRDAFEFFDKNVNGSIDRAELRRIMRILGEKIIDEEVEEIFNEADLDGDGNIDYEEFSEMMLSGF